MTIPFDGVPLAAQRDLVRRLADQGYTDLWSSEVSGTDAFTPLVLASQWTPGLHLGTAIAPVFTRGPALLAQSAAALAELAPGRVTLGVGTSSTTIVTGFNGIPFESPYQRTRDVVRFLRAALAGEKITREFDTFAVHGFALLRPPPVPPRLAVAALRAGMLRLAGREADAAITNWLAPGDVPVVRAELARGAGRPDPELIARIFVCPTGDADLARQVGRRAIAAYLNVPVYAAFHEWLGRGDLLAPMRRAWQHGDRRAALAAIPDQLVDDLVVHGSPAACRDRLASYVDAGVTVPVIALLPVPGAATGPGDAAGVIADLAAITGDLLPH